MYEKVEVCPTCNSRDFKSSIIADDHTVSKESFAIMKCCNCNLLVTSPRPKRESIGKYYQSDDYISHKNKANNLTNFLYKLARKYTLGQKHKLLSRLTEGRKVLDYGCGAGTLLQHLSSKGWDATGIEPDEETRDTLQSEASIPVYASLTDLPKGKFDIITLWHVLEHVHDLNDTIQLLYSSLKKKGILVVAVPNHDSHDRQHYQQNWAAYDVPRHLYHFTQETLPELMKYHKFKLIETHPMKLDAFYVSLLSEKIANGKPNFLKAFKQGLISNRFARNNNNNYSSLIFVFQRP